MSESGGAFKGKISSLLKYNLIDSKDNEIFLTNLAINILNSYDEEEEKKLLFKSFINISLFNQLIDRFKNSGINLDILDKILIREYEIDNKNVKKVSKCIIKSLEFLEILDKETGNFDKSILNKFYDIREVEVVNNSIVQEIKKDVIKDLKNEVPKIKKKESKFGLENDIYELFVYFASKLDPIDKPIDKIEEIIERNEFLTHTKLVFEILKDNLSNNTIDKKNVKNLLKALKQDLKIT